MVKKYEVKTNIWLLILCIKIFQVLLGNQSLRSSLMSMTLLKIWDILFSKPMMLPWVNTTSIYYLYNFSRARMILSNVRISWFIGFYRASSKVLRLDCSWSTCPFSWLFSAYFSSIFPFNDICYSLNSLIYDFADSRSTSFPSFFVIWASSSSLLSFACLSFSLNWLF